MPMHLIAIYMHVQMKKATTELFSHMMMYCYE